MEGLRLGLKLGEIEGDKLWLGDSDGEIEGESDGE
jgi:hypothetical protein